MGETKRCIACGKSYATYRKTDKFCSNDCRVEFFKKKYRKQWNTKRTCQLCGLMYTPTSPRAKFCSLRCTKNDWKRKHKDKVKEYADVYNKAYTQRKTKEKMGLIGKRLCLSCGNTLILDSKNYYRKNYCGLACRVAHWKKIHPEEYKAIQVKNRERTKQWAKENPGKKKETDQQYNDRIFFGGNKAAVIERDASTCQSCGCIPRGKNLVIHHIDGKGYSVSSEERNNDIGNLQVLCRSCHMRVHRDGLRK